MKKLLFGLLVLSACTDARQSKMFGYGKRYKIIVVGCDTSYVYHSSGKVQSEQSSDGYYFEDKATGKLVEVSGTVIIEEEGKE